MKNFRKYLDGSSKLVPQPDWGINVLDVGNHVIPSGAVYPDLAHPEAYFFEWDKGRVLTEYQLVYIASGDGIFESEATGEVKINPGTLFFLYPGVWHRFKPNTAGWTEYWVGFEGHYADHLMAQDCFDPRRPLLQMGFNATFITVFTQLIDTIRFGGLGSNQLGACLTIQLLGLVYASALLKDQSFSRKTQLINNVRYSIHENLDRDISPEEMAAKHHVSYAWFRKAFKEVTGQSPGQYQLGLRIQKACRLLHETTLSISEIAFQTGFESEQYFSRAFKSKISHSPSNYRKEFNRKL